MHTARFRAILLTLLALAPLAGCGGSSSPAGPSPSPTPTPNQKPVVTAAVSPTWGVDSLTQFRFTASTSDPDGDPVSVTWDFGDGTRASGSSVLKTYTSGATFHATASGDDGKAGTTVSGVDVPVGSMTGTWIGSIPGYTNFVFTLAQSGTIVTGTFVEQFFGEGRTDPAAPGHIDATGHMEIRFKLAVFTDFTFRGQMDPTGRRITGGVYGSGFTGEAFEMVKQ